MYLADLKLERMVLNRILALLALTMFIWSCNNDDNGNGTEAEGPRLLSEVIAEDEAEIQEFLETHFYNYNEFNNPPENFDYRVKLFKIAEADSLVDSLKVPLMNFIEKQIVLLSSTDLGLAEGEVDVPHNLYFLKARPGAGENPTVVDSVYLKYEGLLTDGSIFDSRIGEPVWFDLLGTLTESNSGGFVRGFELGLTQFKSGTEIIDNPDGTFDLTDFGSGLIIMPSALGYYNSTNVSEAYTPLIFNIQLLVTVEADHDQDGKPSREEVEIASNGNVTLTDSNGDGLPDYLDDETK